MALLIRTTSGEAPPDLPVGFVDARGDGSLILPISALQPDVIGSAVLNAVSSVGPAVGSLDGLNTATFYFPAGLAGTFIYEITVDGINWISASALLDNGTWVNGSSTATYQGRIVQLDITGIQGIRLRAIAYTSGSVTVFWRLSPVAAVVAIEGGQLSVTQNVGLASPQSTTSAPWLVGQKADVLTATATGISGAAVTLTLAAPGVNIYQIISKLRIQRFAAAALVAAAAPVAVTSTNLGTFTVDMPADAAAQGTLFNDDLNFPMGLRAAVSNTAVTLVAPATTGVIWNMIASYRTSS